MADDALAKEGQFASDREALAEGKTAVELWLEKISAAKKEEREWRDSARIAADTYEAAKDANSAFNIYHSNVEVRVPALYNSTPVPDVRRRWEPDFPQPPKIPPVTEQTPPEVAQQIQFIMGEFQKKLQALQAQAVTYKQVADITERGLYFSVDQYDFDAVMRGITRNSEVTGRGVPRVRYVPHFNGSAIAYEEATCEIVPWDRFIRGPGLSWDKIPFIAFEHDLTKDEIAKIADKRGASLSDLGFSGQRDDGTDDGDQTERRMKGKGVLKTVKVYEIWDRTNKKVLFISPQDKTKAIASIDDPLELTGFFPVPRPLYNIERLASLIPVCPYDVYKPQIDEIANISRRISALITQLKVKGVYDPKLAADFEGLRDAEDGTFMPASASNEFASQHSLDDSIWHWPVDQIQKVLAGLYEQREQVKQTIYEIMGVSDIIRGAVDPREKLGQSEIKAQSGSQRLKLAQNEVARVARDLLRMKAEIMHRHFRPETLKLMTGIEVTPEALKIMRSEMRSYSIDIETDSTVRADVGRRQEELNMFLQGASQIITAAVNAAAVMPQTVPALLEIFISFARQFNLGKQGEDALDDLGEAAKQPPVQPDDGKAAAEQAAQQAAQQAEIDRQAKQEELQAKMALEDRKDQREERKMMADLELSQRKAQADEQMAQLTYAIKQIELEMRQVEMQNAIHQAEIDRQMKLEDRAIKQEEREEMRVDRHEEREAKREQWQIDLSAKREMASINAQAAKQKAKQKPANGVQR